jgi:translocation and assembly module TamB
MAEAATPRKFRRLRRFLAIVIFGPIITVVSLPTILSTGPACSGLVAVANRYLAPGRLKVAELRLSWFGSQEVLGLSFSDAQGKPLVAVSRATLDRSLLELVFDRSGPSTLTLTEPALDVTRRLDGSIDLADFLPKRRITRDPQPTAEPQPPEQGLSEADLTLKVVQGTLRVQAPELIEPLTIDRYNLTVQTSVAPGPVNVRLRMEKRSGAGAATMAIDGTYDLRAATPAAADLSLNLLAQRWPLTARVGGVDARGMLDGQLSAIQKAGRWDLKGDTKLLKLGVAGRTLGGDQLQLDEVMAIWDVVQNPGPASSIWDVRRLKLVSPVATLTASGPILGPPGTGATLEGRVDLAGLARQLPHVLRLRDGLTVERGEAGLRISLKYETDARSAELAAQLSDLVAHDATRTVALRSPANLAARVNQRGSNVMIEQLELASGFLRTSGSGDLDQGIRITGSLDLGALQAQLRDLLDFGAVELAGQGEYTFDYRRAGGSFAGGLTSEFHRLDLKGLRPEPIKRDAVRLQAALSGPSALSGLPQALSELKVGLAAGQIRALATATIRDGATALDLNASGPLTLSEQTDGVVRGDVKFHGTWRAPALEIGDLRVKVHPASVAAEASPPALALRGRFDRAAGELVLSPIAGTPPGALSVAPEGLRVTGLGSGPPTAGVRVEGNLLGDLAALDQLIAALSGAAPYDLAGSWTAKVTAQPQADGRLQWGTGIASPDLSLAGAPGAPRSQEGPVALTARGKYTSAGGQLAFEELRLVTRYASFDATGQLADATGRRVADLQGSLVPNWQTLNAMFAAAAGPGAQLQGGAPRAFRIKGPLAAASLAEVLKGLDLELGVELAGAQAFGMNLGPAPLVVLCDGGRTIMAPIVTTLNNGKVDVRPELGLDDPQGLVLRLLPGSTLQQVEINDQVSHELLSYIAPVLEEATQVRGHLSATFARADFPIGGAADRTMAVAGAILFDNVVFSAGPLGGELLSLAGKGPNTALTINQTIQLVVNNRRIHQSGLVIPINNQTGITVKGSVGFDQTLALRADVPVSPSMLGRDKMLQKLVSGTSIPVAVGGTLTHPKVDRQAMSAAIREVTRSILKRNGESEAAELLKRFVR